MKILLTAGARPNFMKIAPILRAIEERNRQHAADKLCCKIVHTGQHYDYEMSGAFFGDLEIRDPDYFLEAGSGTHAEQTARIMVAFEKVCVDEKSDVVVVVGDVNSTLACSICAKKLNVPVAHVEAGLRSFDMSMPEEINRVVTDSIADYFFVTERSAIDNLLREGKPENRIYFVGHVMIDNLLHQVRKLDSDDPTRFSTYHRKMNTPRYIFLTLHRPSNVDNRDTLSGIAEAINEISFTIPIFFPAHPRTMNRLKELNIRFSDNVRLLPPLGFRESLFLWKDAVAVMTDSGGLQEETTGLGVPCITLRDNTERPITVQIGTNVLAGQKKESIESHCFEILNNGYHKGEIPPLWDGHAGERIVSILCCENMYGSSEI